MKEMVTTVHISDSNYQVWEILEVRVDAGNDDILYGNQKYN